MPLSKSRKISDSTRIIYVFDRKMPDIEGVAVNCLQALDQKDGAKSAPAQLIGDVLVGRASHAHFRKPIGQNLVADAALLQLCLEETLHALLPLRVGDHWDCHVRGEI